MGKHIVGSTAVKFVNHKVPPSASSSNLMTAIKNFFLIKIFQAELLIITIMAWRQH